MTITEFMDTFLPNNLKQFNTDRVELETELKVMEKGATRDFSFALKRPK